MSTSLVRSSLAVPSSPTPVALPELAIARISEFFSGSSSVPHTNLLAEVVAEVSVTGEGEITLSSDEGTSVLTQIYKISHDCTRSECRMFVEGWISQVEGQPTRKGPGVTVWGQVILGVEPEACQADAETRAHWPRHRG